MTKMVRNTAPIYDVGDKVGKLTVIAPCYREGANRIYYTTQCDCGKITTPLKRNFEKGMSKSCGCTRGGSGAISNPRGGIGSTRIAKIWRMMHHRVEHNTDYLNKGIRVAEEWSDLKAFFDWSMANGYSDRLTIDRIDNSKGYAPDNCRWATRQVQSANRDCAASGELVDRLAVAYFYSNDTFADVLRDHGRDGDCHLKRLVMALGWPFPMASGQARYALHRRQKGGAQ